MEKRYTLSLFIFRHDIRCDDNIGLLHALEMSDNVIPCFIFDTTELEIGGDHAQQFLHEALEDLDATLHKKRAHLYFFHGKAPAVVKKLLATAAIDAVFINRSYTPSGINGEKQLNKVCAEHNRSFHVYDDAVLVAPETITKRAGGYYTVFTPFCRALLKQKIQSPTPCRATHFYNKKLPGERREWMSAFRYKKNRNCAVRGKRADALAIIKTIAEYGEYDRKRNIPSLNATTHLSAFIAVGLCSVREVYHAVAMKLGPSHTLIKQLCWHDFFISIALHCPEVFEGAFHKKYNKLVWSDNRTIFKRWCSGTTGFPIVDAGIRELNATGFMHNRVRMIVASFLVKDLHINWQWGEDYFANKLIDYDKAVNNGNWQWVASTGCDAQPYFRIFNPWIQQKTYDRDGAYIKQWIPELADVPSKDIHAWCKVYGKYQNVYYAPMVDHAIESIKTKIAYKKLTQMH